MNVFQREVCQPNGKTEFTIYAGLNGETLTKGEMDFSTVNDSRHNVIRSDLVKEECLNCKKVVFPLLREDRWYCCFLCGVVKTKSTPFICPECGEIMSNAGMEKGMEITVDVRCSGVVQVDLSKDVTVEGRNYKNEIVKQK